MLSTDRYRTIKLGCHSNGSRDKMKLKQPPHLRWVLPRMKLVLWNCLSCDHLAEWQLWPSSWWPCDFGKLRRDFEHHMKSNMPTLQYNVDCIDSAVKLPTNSYKYSTYWSGPPHEQPSGVLTAVATPPQLQVERRPLWGEPEQVHRELLCKHITYTCSHYH